MGVKVILEHLDKSYGIDATVYRRFHTRVDRIAKLNIDAKLKGRLLCAIPDSTLIRAT